MYKRKIYILNKLIYRLTTPKVVIALVTAIFGPYVVIKVTESMERAKIESQVIIENRKLQADLLAKLMESVGTGEIDSNATERILLLTSLVKDNKSFNLEFPTLEKLNNNKRLIERKKLEDEASNNKSLINEQQIEISKLKIIKEENEEKLKKLKRDQKALTVKLSKDSRKSADLKEKISTAGKEIERITSENDALERKTKSAEQEMHILSGTLKSKINELEMLSSQHELKDKTISQLKEEIRQRDLKITQIETSVSNYNKTLAELEWYKLNREGNREEIRKTAKQLEDSYIFNQDLNTEKNKIQSELDASKNLVASLKMRIGELESTASNFSSKDLNPTKKTSQDLSDAKEDSQRKAHNNTFQQTQKIGAAEL